MTSVPSRTNLPTPEQVEQLVNDHVDYCEALARRRLRRFPSHIGLDDVVREAQKGLMQAARNYDFNSEASFRTFAYYRINGAITDFARRECREFQRPQDIFEDAADEVARSLAGSPKPTNAAEAVAAIRGAGQSAMVAARLSLSALKQEPVDHRTPDPHQQALVGQIWNQVGALSALDPKLPEVFALHFRDGYSMEEIAIRLGVNRSTVFRWVQQGVEKIRDAMKFPAQHKIASGSIKG